MDIGFGTFCAAAEIVTLSSVAAGGAAAAFG
jgi:hypothetical protein